MKVPLRFQITEYDCGTVSLLNALSYLFERENMPLELVKEIYKYTISCHTEDGVLGKSGKQKENIKNLIKWATDLTKKKDYGVKFTRCEQREVNIENIRSCIKNKGVVYAKTYRCHDISEHYVIITSLDESNAYVFDPYFLDERHYDMDSDVSFIFDEPFRYNRIVKLERLLSNTKKDLSLGRTDVRECILIERVKKPIEEDMNKKKK